MKIKGREKSSTDYNKVICSKSNICKKRGRHYVNPEGFLSYEIDNGMILEVLQDTRTSDDTSGLTTDEQGKNSYSYHPLRKTNISRSDKTKRSRFKRLIKLRQRSRRCKLILFCLLFTIFIFFLLFFYQQSNNSTKLIDRDIFSILDLRPHKCYYPKLNPFNSEIMKLLSTAGNFTFGNCSWNVNGVNTSFIANHHYLIKTAELRGKNVDPFNDETPTCCYQPFYRTNDVQNWMSPTCTKITENVTKITEEFVKLYCKMPVFHKDYYDMFAFIPEKPEVEARIAKINKEKEMKTFPHQNNSNNNSDPNQLSVIIFGMDSVSHMNFIRLMRKTHRYLVKKLDAIPLHGYNKVSENTLPNVIPLLSGLSLAEFKKLCVKERTEPDVSKFGKFGVLGMAMGRDFPYVEEKVHLDTCPFIWNEFSSQGYRTSFAEDQNSIGIFNMYWNEAYGKQPTDYYLRTLTRQMEIVFGPGHCQGTRTSFKILLDNVLNMAEAFKNRLYFQVTWSTRLSHDHAEYIQYGDDDFLKTIKTLNQSGHLNNSILIIMSDHGSRSDKIRQTRQGQIEDRMPLAYIRVPDWFHKKFPLAMKNLKKNSERLTTPYEVHHTLKEFMNLSGLLDHEIKRRSTSLTLEYEESQRKNWRKSIVKHQSLFLEIPETRSCFQAQIPLHWCLCHLKEPMNNFQENGQVNSAVDFTINFLNKLISSKTDKCAHLRLKLVLNALKWMDEKIQGSQPVSNQNSTKGFEFETGKKIDDHEEVLILEISFMTEPGEASFEATVIKLPSDGTWALTERVVRTNSYGDQSDCIDDHDIKEYCYCEPMDYLM